MNLKVHKGAYSKRAPRAVCFSSMVLKHINLEYSSILLMVQDHKILMAKDHMVLDHKSRPKSHKSFFSSWIAIAVSVVTINNTKMKRYQMILFLMCSFLYLSDFRKTIRSPCIKIS